MDASKARSTPNPRKKANIISVLTWWWTIELFKKGYRKVLIADDLHDPLSEDRSTALGDRLEKQWNYELKTARKCGRQPSLLKTIFLTFRWEYFMLGLMQVLNEFVIRLGTPILLGGLLSYFKKNTNVTIEEALYYAGGIALASAVNVITLNQAIFGAFHIGGRIRVAVCSLVYRKALNLSMTALGETAPGKVVNLVANDVNRFDVVSVFLHYLWSAPISTLIITYFLYNKAGWAGIIGIAAVFIVVPLQSYLGKLSSKYRLQTALKTDERVQLMDEIVSGVQVIKMYAWEKPFCALIELARKLELRVVTKTSYIRGIYMSFNLFTTRMALWGTMIAMVFFDQELTADTIFVISAYFNILAQTMSSMFVRGVAETAECMVAVRRLQYFLMYDEFQKVIGHTKHSSENNINRGSMQSINQVPKSDLPYIDDELIDKNAVPDDYSREKSNGVAILASDLLKDTVDLVNEKSKNMTDNKIALNKEQWAIKLTNVTAKWEPYNPEKTLDSVNLQFGKGKLYAVIGMVGAGKSSLLSVLLGELPLSETKEFGDVEVKGGLSYAGQDAWVFGATVRQNIIFGQPYERQRYHRVTKACALLSDFEQFPQGDLTIVGDRGSSLSGGQRARINLARAVYRQADIYLLDDPLSAVDAHVGKHLFEECIQRYLAGKTRILVTHQLQYLQGVDAIILLNQGRAETFSNYQELLASYPDYEALVGTMGEGDASASERGLPNEKGMRRQYSSTSHRSQTPDASGSIDTDMEDEDEENEGLDTVEGTSRGTIQGSVFLKYFQAGGSLFIAFTVAVLFIATQVAASLNDMFVSYWVDKEESRGKILVSFEESLNGPAEGKNVSSNLLQETRETQFLLSTETYMYIYTGILVALFVTAIARSMLFYKLCMWSSQSLHDRMFGSLIRTSMRFFDTNPSGRILNRFSKDMGAIDELLPKALLDAGQVIMLMIGSLIVACTVNPMFLIPVVVMGAIFAWIRKVYLRTSKNVKRLEGITRSPVFTHLNATLNGLSTIRAYGAQDILKYEFDKHQDLHTSSWYMFITTSTAFGFSLDFFCLIFITLVTFSFILIKGNFSGSEVGLAITQAMALTGVIQWGMRQSAEVANQLMSVERVIEYTQLPPEPNLRDKGIIKKSKAKSTSQPPPPPPQDWPSHGCVRLTDVYMRYVEDEAPVLKGLNLVIRPGEKVGIVGRTGAGKSSLISALFRLAKIEGSMQIDDIDTGSICLEDLRARISIIPQDPVLFSGTLRRNLDPFEEFPDRLLWEALDEVELKEAITTGANGLDSRVLKGGSNYSVGQRQLVCLARAILRNNRILMLDEATANVDPHTDALIQRTIRTKFASCTVLTVAHRLNTIMDSDKVLLMDRGRMAEYDHPYLLLQNEYGHFSSMVKETGRAMYEQLAKIAEQSYKAK
ncbi:ATP-binding cassette sub-family C member 4-like isoform X1 [Diprion similis]|uniref:ATP-binding cassette sub-family C member 4-like isoform X1 n=1 Tax=Diprion similis TaxID=362088 RepID=UPI001EF9009D|nr:ATP-binding cassette sub-family C member 4-like isoform X1 [Diprion similis]XP_046746118.1 ATP-binding cassette sub-family C member 4-like isoform X1 [Diprion similis]